jgi:hypothetical protein
MIPVPRASQPTKASPAKTWSNNEEEKNKESRPKGGRFGVAKGRTIEINKDKYISIAPQRGHRLSGSFITTTTTSELRILPFHDFLSFQFITTLIHQDG